MSNLLAKISSDCTNITPFTSTATPSTSGELRPDGTSCHYSYPAQQSVAIFSGAAIHGGQFSVTINTMAVFILEDALSVQKDNASSPFLYLRPIIRLDELGQTFVVRLVMRLWHKDGHKTYYTSRRAILRNAS